MSKLFLRFAALIFSVAFAVGVQSSLQVAAATIDCGHTSTGNTALTDLGPRMYQGEQGGLYPGGTNIPPAAYQAAGVQAGRSIVPLDTSGRVNAAGKIVFISIGMSNTSMEFGYFASTERRSDPKRNAAVAFVDGGQGGKTALYWANASDSTWSVLKQRLAGAGYTDRQVEVAWLKEADFAKPPSPPSFETYMHTLAQELAQITSIAAQRFPNLRQVFVSARSYSGYAVYGASPNPEPWSYETGFADKWFVARSVANPTQRPWVGWGPYFWTDGTRGRADGLQWLCSDTSDGTHPSSTGLAKINTYMHSLFVGSVFTPWFTGSTPISTQSPSPVPVHSPIATPPVASPVVPPGAAHPATARPGATQQSQSPVGSIPKPSGIAGSFSQAIVAVSSMPPPERWSVLAIAIVVIGGVLAAFASRVLPRRLRFGDRRSDDGGPPPTH